MIGAQISPNSKPACPPDPDATNGITAVGTVITPIGNSSGPIVRDVLPLDLRSLVLAKAVLGS